MKRKIDTALEEIPRKEQKEEEKRSLPYGLHLLCSRNWTNILVTEFDYFYVNMNSLKERFNYFAAWREEQETFFFPPETFELWNSTNPMDLAMLLCSDPDFAKDMGHDLVCCMGGEAWGRPLSYFGFSNKQWFSVTMAQVGWGYFGGNEAFIRDMIVDQIRETSDCSVKWGQYIMTCGWNSLEETWKCIKKNMNQQRLVTRVDDMTHIWYVALLIPLVVPLWKSVYEESMNPNSFNSPSLRARWKIQDQHLPVWAMKWLSWMNGLTIDLYGAFQARHFIEASAVCLFQLALIDDMIYPPESSPEWIQDFQKKDQYYYANKDEPALLPEPLKGMVQKWTRKGW